MGAGSEPDAPRRLRFTIPIAPRTKKTSNRISGLGAKCPNCGKHEFQQVQPSASFAEWFDLAMTYSAHFRRVFLDAGIELPISVPVSVEATFFRDARRGDLIGYEQALADWMQAPKDFHSRKTGRIVRRRNGAGLIEDDELIRDWDGSRLEVDRDAPRTVATITILDPDQRGFSWREDGN